MVLKKNSTYLGYRLLNLLTIKRHKKQFYGDIVFGKERIVVKKGGKVVLIDLLEQYSTTNTIKRILDKNLL